MLRKSQYFKFNMDLLDGKLGVAAAASVLLDAVEHEVAPGAVVQLPCLLL